MAVFSTFRLLAAGIAAAAALTSHVLPARELLTPAVAAYDELAPDLTEPEDTTLSEGAVTIPVPLPEEGSVTISQAAPNTPPAAHTPAVAPVTPAQAAASVKIPSGPLVTDSLFTDAYRAYRKGNLDELLRLQPQLTGHPLASYVDLWVLLLNAQANPKDQETVRQLDRFISTRQNDYVAERARADWARIAAKNDDARLFYRLYKKLEWNREEPDLVCSKARFDLKTGDRKKTAALAAARTTLRDTPLAADPACVRLRNDYLALRPKDAWPQLLVLLQQKRFQPARDIIARYSRQLPAARGTLLAVLNNPSKWYRNNKNRLARQKAAVLLFAGLRLAGTDPEAAARIASTAQKKLSQSRAALLWSRVAYESALDLEDNAPRWYRKAGRKPGSAPDTVGQSNILLWQARTALRTGNWHSVRRAVEELPASIRNTNDWLYWKARALEKTGQPRTAQSLMQKVSRTNGFYGLLSRDALKKSYYDAHDAGTPVPADAAVFGRFASDPSVLRALRFYELGLTMEGNREWNWALRKMDKSERLLFAGFAESLALTHRQINTSESTRTFVFEQQYPRPHREEIESAARNAGLEPEWIFGLIRQESRFLRMAESTVGARGLMQVMPRTARWVARQKALQNFEDGKLTDLATNLTIGCEYLRLVADAFSGSKPLATAAYNAGPSRAVSWRAKLDHRTEGAVFVETIPFNETRNYVKLVLANTMHYAFYYKKSNKTTLSDVLGDIDPKAEQPVFLP